MTTFIQLHLLTAYPAANLNRDDTGAPKTVVLGGATRLRISSQSLKRAWRTSELFEQALAGNIGIRSGRIAREAAQILIDSGIDAKKAVEYVEKIANCFGKIKADKKAKDPLTNADTEQLVHISPAEFEAVKALAHRLAEEKRPATEEEAALLRHDRMAVDIAMFGRMLANKPDFNVEAAARLRTRLASAKLSSKMISLPPLTICAPPPMMQAQAISAKPALAPRCFTPISASTKICW